MQQWLQEFHGLTLGVIRHDALQTSFAFCTPTPLACCDGSRLRCLRSAGLHLLDQLVLRATSVSLPASCLGDTRQLTWTFLMYSSVVTQSSRPISLPFIASARSLVMTPSTSMHSTQAASRSCANSASSGVPSSFARKARPRVQAKIEATGLVDVSCPCWYCR